MDFKVPELGEGVYEAELVAWHVKPGEPIKRGQSLAEVITDKASMDLSSPFAGVVDELRAEPGQPFKIGDVLLTYREGAKEEDGEEMRGRRGERVKERVGEGANGRTGQRAKPELTDGPTRGRTTGRPAGHPLTPSPPQPTTTPPRHSLTTILAAPSVRQRARALGVDLNQVHGSGPAGRILAADLATATQAQAPSKSLPAVAGQEPSTEPRKPIADVGRPGTRIKLAGLRKKSAEHLVHAKLTAPHFSLIDECDVTDLVRLRAQLKEPLAQEGVRLTYLPFVVKAVVAALKEVPIANASLDDAAGEIVLHDRYHVGISTSTPGGLIVPVVRDADQKNVVAIAREIDRLTANVRSGRPKLEDLRGSTFTITSVGGIGGLISTPILNHPEVGILGVGRIVKRPVYDEVGNIHPADMVYLSFSFDHRVVDGAVAVIFANAVMQHLRRPAAMLL